MRADLRAERLGIDRPLVRVLLAGLLTLGSASTALAAPAADAAPLPAKAPRIHHVQRGDTLYGIAGRYGVSVGSILSANGLKTDAARLKLGQRLTIPPASGPARSSAPAARRVRPVALKASSQLPRDFILAVPKFQDAPPPFQWPVEGSLTSMFGRRRMGWHRGLDIQAEPGTPVLAAATGYVVASFVEPRYGNVVKIAHDNGFVTVYAHNEKNLVDVGDWVSAGQTIATVGRTGRATSEHLHFEIRHEGLVYNPLYLLPLPPRTAQADEAAQEEHDDD